MSAHKSLSTTDLHEPKGVAAATVDEVYVADGAASGAWAKITEDSIDSSAAAGATDALFADGAGAAVWTTFNNLNLHSVMMTFVDLQIAASQWMTFPIAGNIVKIYTVIDETLGGSDTNMTFEIAGTPMTNSAIVITAVGSNGGDVDSSTPSAANTLTAGQALEVISDGGTSTTAICKLTFLVDTS